MNILRLTACALLVLGVNAVFRPVSVQPSVPKARSSFVAVPGSRLYYEECGSGAEAVVLIHDGVVHSAVWGFIETNPH
jgi:3-oxoadipate enol-lactonase